MAKEISTDDVKIQQVSDIQLKDGVISTSNNVVEATAEALNKEYTGALAFMEEEIEILLQESSDENAENPVIVGCNGQFKAFYRGVATKAKRKFVDCLIVKTGRVSTPEFINNAGERARAIRQNSAHKYPFMVINDRNPKGAEWFKQRLAEAV